MKNKMELTVGEYCKLGVMEPGFFVIDKSEYPNITLENLWYKQGNTKGMFGRFCLIINFGKRANEGLITADAEKYVYSLKATNIQLDDI